MEPKINDSIVIRKYLLGELSEKEQQGVEKHLLLNGEYFERVRAVESELTEAYISGGLSGGDREKFERYFMAAPERQESVKYAKEIRRYFLEKIASQSQKEEAGHRKQRDEGRGRFRLLFGTPNLVMKVSIAAMFILIAIGAFVLWKTSGVWSNRLTHYGSPRQHEKNESQDKIGSKPANQAEGGIDQAQFTKEGRGLSGSGKPSPNGYKSPKVDVISLDLLPGQTMGGDRTSVKLPAQSQVLRLILHLEDDRHRDFRVELRTDEDGQVWSRNDLKVRPDKRDRIIEAEIPTRILNRKDYKVIVSAKADQSRYDRLASYSFKVEDE